jgi:hypothetical protein
VETRKVAGDAQCCASALAAEWHGPKPINASGMSVSGMVRPCSCPASDKLARGAKRPASVRIISVKGHDTRLMPARYVRPYSKGQKERLP